MNFSPLSTLIRIVSTLFALAVIVIYIVWPRSAWITVPVIAFELGYIILIWALAGYGRHLAVIGIAIIAFVGGIFFVWHELGQPEFIMSCKDGTVVFHDHMMYCDDKWGTYQVRVRYYI